MNRINQLFQNKNKNILSIYITAGFPNLNDTVFTIEILQKNGVDLVEIGIPFSDPMADGVVIQQSSQTALKNGMSIRKLFSQLTSIREKIHIPLVMMGYLNPVMQFGFEEFCKECKRVDVDGMIIPDLPMADYLSDYKPIADKYGLKFIFLITPETSEERIREIDNNTDGFIYMVSSASVTGVQNSFEKQIAYFQRINSMKLKNPRLVGFGISNKETKETAFQYASGAIIGSAFIKTQTETESAKEAINLLMSRLNN
ncbi:Tryptophan synthase alpha chain [uncultured Paludibacter sp.]|uniref:Tryptophan synthase alpha chain n=1 Tax=uncultured Paludibacter sp. TaxID=497635 RepID=A0A653A9F8_9BACT|nr:Tryptophan synthase alpha chain [uncultured Paludibacter sp.]